MVFSKESCSRTDKIAAFFLALILLTAALGSLNQSCDWGDDFAAYMNEAFAIADGRLEEQGKLNAYMHPSPVGDNVEESLVYVWGYPLFLSAIYRLTGFDVVQYSNLILYKLPSVVFFVIMAVSLFLLCRKRGFSASLCFFSVLALCSSDFYYEMINSLYSDVVYAGFCMLLLLLIERFLSQEDRKKSIVSAFAVGMIMWYTFEVRTSGVCFLVVLLIGQLLNVLRMRRSGRKDIGKTVCIYLIPYICFFALRFVLENFILLPASLNSEDARLAGTEMIFANMLYYLFKLHDFIHEIIFSVFSFFLSPLASTRFLSAAADFSYSASSFLAWFTLAVLALGIITCSRGADIPVAVYIVGFGISTCLLPYNQGLRYLMGIMPAMLIFVLYGYKRLLTFLRKILHIGRPKRGRGAAVLLCVLLSIAVMFGRMDADMDNVRTLVSNGNDIHKGMTGAYSPDAVEMYAYIKENTEEDDIIAFTKPRALYLNTGRLAFSFLSDRHDPLDADYCVLTTFFYDYYTNEEAPDWFSEFEVVMRNTELAVLKKLK